MDEEEKVPQPKFTFGKRLTGSSEETKENQPGKNAFSFSFKVAQPEERKGEFGAAFKTEAKMFTNKNLFVNPMIVSTKPPSLKKLKTGDEDSSNNRVVVLKKREIIGKTATDDQDAKTKPGDSTVENKTIPSFKSIAPFVQVNPLNSSESLKI